MKAQKRICLLLLAVLWAIIFTACSTHSNMAFTFNVETGDSVKVSLDTSNGLQLTQDDGKFSVNKGDQKVLQGMFITKQTYDSYIEITDSSDVTVIEEGNGNNNNAYRFYECEGNSGKEYDYIVWVSNSNTGVLIGSIEGKDEVKAAFDKLTISKE